MDAVTFQDASSAFVKRPDSSASMPLREMSEVVEVPKNRTVVWCCRDSGIHHPMVAALLAAASVAGVIVGFKISNACLYRSAIAALGYFGQTVCDHITSHKSWTPKVRWISWAFSSLKLHSTLELQMATGFLRTYGDWGQATALESNFFLAGVWTRDKINSWTLPDREPRIGKALRNSIMKSDAKKESCCQRSKKWIEKHRSRFSIGLVGLTLALSGLVCSLFRWSVWMESRSLAEAPLLAAYGITVLSGLVGAALENYLYNVKLRDTYLRAQLANPQDDTQLEEFAAQLRCSLVRQAAHAVLTLNGFFIGLGLVGYAHFKTAAIGLTLMPLIGLYAGANGSQQFRAFRKDERAADASIIRSGSMQGAPPDLETPLVRKSRFPSRLSQLHKSVVQKPSCCARVINLLPYLIPAGSFALGVAMAMRPVIPDAGPGPETFFMAAPILYYGVQSIERRPYEWQRMKSTKKVLRFVLYYFAQFSALNLNFAIAHYRSLAHMTPDLRHRMLYILNFGQAVVYALYRRSMNLLKGSQRRKLFRTDLVAITIWNALLA